MTIYHNPACGTSRNTLALIRNAGIEPNVVEYLTSPPSRAVLADLVAGMGGPVRSAGFHVGASSALNSCS